MSQILQVGLIGFGMAGQMFHAPFITNVPGFNLKTIRATNAGNIALARERYPQAEIVPDVQAIFNDPEIDLVVVASPNTSHYQLSREALLAGKHVLVDKPFTPTSAEADELIQLAKTQNKLITVYHNRRWDGDALTVKKIIQSKMLGNLVEYEVHFDRFRNFIKPGTWKEEDTEASGILYDLGAHLIDGAQVLFGLPEEITADLRTQRTGGKIIDNFEVILHYPGLKVTLKSGMLVKEPTPHYLLLGDHGSFIKYGLDVQEEALKAGLHPGNTPNWGVEPEANWGRINTEYNGLHIMGKVASQVGDYRGLYQNVYGAILGQEELDVTPEQARNTIRIIELAMQSHTEKRTVPYMDR
ncbi:Gfo/Idh/MocA family oxidoreductase [Adhaeribacter aquaticus]|uniref:Gfo/Idh/MocA family oxidoreductase n=1 Tax=Adhaeribacter aquaticus TaxID=299567 RepID=UPI0004163594|nr:Gfo/Idh/MocA family oxidoreductase [Adhaeribacter aquaticus]